MLTQQQPQPVAGKGIGVGSNVSPSLFNSKRINAVTKRFAWHVQLGNQSDPVEFFNLCLSLSRGIDYAVSNNEVPGNVQDLPTLLKQICQRKNDLFLQAATMVLMISVKNACKVGWFNKKETEEIIAIANEIGKNYWNTGDVNAGPSCCHSTISTIMERFYPKMKMGQILASLEVKPGYRVFAFDFHISKDTAAHSSQDQIRLLVAQTDNIETSACLINPQQVSFLLNGKGVEGRTNVLMDTGPQMPTNVTDMLEYGTNLLQAVGQFNGHYVILVAVMSVTSLPENTVLQDYAQPAVTSVDSDYDIIEGPSQISLDCPISFTRIKTPVKGRSCNHFQCFDFNNFIDINSSRPSWRCPHCNHYVCYEDIRLDQNMVEVLKDVGENIGQVVIRADGSWKAALESDQNGDKKALPDVVDLTNNDDQKEIVDIKTEDMEPPQADLHFQSFNPYATFLATADGFSPIPTDTEIQQHISQPLMNLPQVSGSSSALLHHTATQSLAPQLFDPAAPSHLPSPCRTCGSLPEFHNPYLQQTLNARTYQAMIQSLSTIGSSNPQQVDSQASIGQAAGTTKTRQQASVLAATQIARQSPTILVQNQASIAAMSSMSEQNWKPIARMQGSLSGGQYSDAVRELIIEPTQAVQSSVSQGPQPI